MSISQKKTCSLLSGCWCVQYFQFNQVIELDLGFATALVNSKSPLASTNWETPEISLCFRVLLLAFQIVGDLRLLYIQLLALWVPGEFFLPSSFALGSLYLGSTPSAQLSCTNLWTTSALHWVRVQSVLETFFFLVLWPFHESFAVRDFSWWSFWVCFRGLSLCSPLQPSLPYTRERPCKFQREVSFRILALPSLWYIRIFAFGEVSWERVG